VKKFVFVSNNPNKINEIQNLVEGRFIIVTPKDIGFMENIEENFPTIEGNARLKAFTIYSRYGIDCFADDTGLEVDALKGEPGVHSARYAGSSQNSSANIEKLLNRLENINERSARFRTVIALFLDHNEYYFEGIVNGRILEKLQGDNGFGYDPVFMPDGCDRTFAEMTISEKNKLSHRAIAIHKLVEFLKKIE